MFYSLCGNLLHIGKDFVAIDCSGVSYLVFVSFNTKKDLPNKNEQVFLYTYTNIRENSVEIFGFKTQEEHSCFTLLISVSGVGSRICLAILSELLPENIIYAIASNNPKVLTKTNGVGLKLASRIILELKDRIKNLESKDCASLFISEEAISALMSLGYKKDQAIKAISKLDNSLPTEELIRLSLKSMSRR